MCACPFEVNLIFRSRTHVIVASRKGTYDSKFYEFDFWKRQVVCVVQRDMFRSVRIEGTHRVFFVFWVKMA